MLGRGGGGGKSNRFNQENILQVLLQILLVSPLASQKKWQKRDNSNGCGKGVTGTQDEVGMHLNRTSSPSSMEMRDSNLNKSCAQHRGAAQEGVIESVHGGIAGKLQVSQADPVTSGILLELITGSSLLPLCVSDTESGFWSCDKPLATIIHLVDRHTHLGLLSRQNWSFVSCRKGLDSLTSLLEYLSCSVIDGLLTHWSWQQAFSNIMNACV